MDGSYAENSFKIERSEECLFKNNTALLRKKFNIERVLQDLQVTEIKTDEEVLLVSRIKQNYKKTSNDINLISNVLKTHFVFKYLNEEKMLVCIANVIIGVVYYIYAKKYKLNLRLVIYFLNLIIIYFYLLIICREELIDLMLFAAYSGGECVYKQGEQPQNFFIISTFFLNSLIIIEKGSFTRTFDGDNSKINTFNKSFGFKSIFYEKNRASSIFSNEESEVFILEKNALKNGLLDIRNCLYEQMRQFMSENRLFSSNKILK